MRRTWVLHALSAFAWCVYLPIPHPPIELTQLTASLQNIYYGTLYAYTPEVLPSAHRGTGNGISIGLNRIMGIVSAGVAA